MNPIITPFIPIVAPSPFFNKLSKEEQEIIRQIDYYCYDQQGCRMLQKKLEEHQKNIDFNHALIACVTPFFQDLMID